MDLVLGGGGIRNVMENAVAEHQVTVQKPGTVVGRRGSRVCVPRAASAIPDDLRSR